MEHHKLLANIPGTLPIIMEEIEFRDESQLAEMGYKQELRRDWGLIHNFGENVIMNIAQTIKSLSDQVQVFHFRL